MDFLSIHESQVCAVRRGAAKKALLSRPGLGPIYSYRRANMGSTLVARRAGQ